MYERIHCADSNLYQLLAKPTIYFETTGIDPLDMSNKVLLLCLTLCKSLEAIVITIHPLNSNISCPAEACYSLSQLYEDTPDGLKIPSNTTVEFLYARYQLQSSIVIRDVTNVEIACSSAGAILL